MNITRSLLPALILATAVAAEPKPDGAPEPSTLMTLRGRLLFAEDFAKPVPMVQRGDREAKTRTNVWRVGNGQWTPADGSLHGIVVPEGNFHPATLHRPLEYRDAVIQVDVRLDDIPLDPAPADRTNSVGITLRESTTSHLAFVRVSAGGLMLGKVRPKDPARPGSGMMNDFEQFARCEVALKPGEWHTLVVEIRGAEIVATLNGQHAITSTRPGLDQPKIQLSLDTTRSASVRNLRVWEALPNPDSKLDSKR